MHKDGPTGELTLRVAAMPSDANSGGDIFGGWVLSQMDIAAGIAAAVRAKGRTATVAIEAMTFIRPVYIGDVLTVYTSIVRTGRTSVSIAVEAWATRSMIGLEEKVTDGVFTFVALESSGKKRQLPPE